MGWWGSLIVGRSDQQIAELAALEEYGQTLELWAELGDGWQVWAHNGWELADDVEGWLPAFAAECESPVLTAYFFDSDCADVRGFGARSGPWAACLGRESMQSYLSEDGGNVEETFPSAQAAALLAARWSAEAGYAADDGALVRVLKAGRGKPFAEDLFDDLLEALGLPVEPTP